MRKSSHYFRHAFFVYMGEGFGRVNRIGNGRKEMNMKFVFILLMIVRSLNISGSAPVRTVILKQLLKPGSVLVTDNKWFISQKGSILVFDPEHGEMIDQFGTRGSGPGEFMGVIKLHEMRGNIMVSSLNKVSLFTPRGSLIREMVPSGGKTATVSGFQPLNSGFIAGGSIMHKRAIYRTVNLYDRNLKFVKELYRSPVGSPLNFIGGKNNFFKQTFAYRSSGDRVFVAGSCLFRIDIFNGAGKALGKIVREYQQIHFTGKNRREFLTYLKENSPSYVFRDMASRIEFPEKFPVIFLLCWDDEILYIFTWKRREGGLETFLYTQDGKYLETKYLPINFAGPVMFTPFTIYQGKIYQLVEDEKEETWMLRIIPIR